MRPPAEKTTGSCSAYSVRCTRPPGGCPCWGRLSERGQDAWRSRKQVPPHDSRSPVPFSDSLSCFHEGTQADAQLIAGAIEQTLGRLGCHVEFGGYLAVGPVVELMQLHGGALARRQAGHGGMHDARQFVPLERPRRRLG